MPPRIRRVAAHRSLRIVAVGGLALLAGCGADASPTAPSPRPAPIPVIITVAPNPLKASAVSDSGGVVTYRFTAEVTYSTDPATGVRIDRLTMTNASTQTTSGVVLSGGISLTTDVSIQVPPGSTVIHRHEVTVGNSQVEGMTWQIGASGVDSGGRPFTASSAQVPIEFVATNGSGS